MIGDVNEAKDQGERVGAILLKTVSETGVRSLTRALDSGQKRLVVQAREEQGGGSYRFTWESSPQVLD